MKEQKLEVSDGGSGLLETLRREVFMENDWTCLRSPGCTLVGNSCFHLAHCPIERRGNTPAVCDPCILLPKTIKSSIEFWFVPMNRLVRRKPMRRVHEEQSRALGTKH